MLERKIEFADYLMLLAIRYLYLFLTVAMLNGVWYRGYGSYGVDFSIGKELVAGLTYLVIAFLYILIMREGTFRTILVHILFCIYYIPLSCSFSINNLSISYFIASTIYVVLMILFLSGRSKVSEGSLEKRKSTPNFDAIMNSKLIWLVFLAICILYIIYKISYNGFNLNLSLGQDEVYSNRAEYLDYRTNVSGSVTAYATTFLSGIVSFVIPAFLYFSLRRKDFLGVLVSALTLLSQFSVSSGKSGLFFVGIIIYIILCEQFNLLSSFNSLFTKSILLLLLVTLAEYIISGKSVIYWYILRRELYIPSWIGSMYYEYFTNNTALYFSDSVFLLQSVIPNSYDFSSVELISRNYFNGAIPSPNAGLFAEAVMQCGYIGVILFPVLISLLMKSIGKIFDRYGLGFSCLAAAQVAISLTNVPILRTDSILSIFSFAVLMGIGLYLSNKKVTGVRESMVADTGCKTAELE